MYCGGIGLADFFLWLLKFFFNLSILNQRNRLYNPISDGVLPGNVRLECLYGVFDCLIVKLMHLFLFRAHGMLGARVSSWNILITDDLRYV